MWPTSSFRDEKRMPENVLLPGWELRLRREKNSRGLLLPVRLRVGLEQRLHFEAILRLQVYRLGNYNFGLKIFFVSFAGLLYLIFISSSGRLFIIQTALKYINATERSKTPVLSIVNARRIQFAGRTAKIYRHVTVR